MIRTLRLAAQCLNHVTTCPLNIQGYWNPLLLPLLNSLLWIHTKHKSTGYWEYTTSEFLLSHFTTPIKWPPILLLKFWCILIQKSPNIVIKCIFRSAVSRSLDWWSWACGVTSEVSRPHPTSLLLVGAFKGHGVPGENTKYEPPKRTHYRCMCHITPYVLKGVRHKWQRHIHTCDQCNSAYIKHDL